MGLRVPPKRCGASGRCWPTCRGRCSTPPSWPSLGGASHTTAARYLDVLVDTMMVRRLPPYLANIGKRLVKSPKVYLRDSGLLHALLGLATVRDLQGHPVAGSSWEGFVVEQVAAQLPRRRPDELLPHRRGARSTS